MKIRTNILNIIATISSLQTPPFILEKLKFNRLSVYLEGGYLLRQAIWLPFPSFNWPSLVSSIIDKVQKAIEDREYSYEVFLDFSKAFGTVNQLTADRLAHFVERRTTEQEASASAQAKPTLRVLKKLRRICNDNCKWLDILVSSDKHW